MKGFDFLGFDFEKKPEPETRKLPHRILFRGKLKSGAWSYGNLNIDQNGVCVIRPGLHTAGKYGRVNPETVGQATGIRDKNGQDIFEGDILKIHHATFYPVDLAIVQYDKQWSRFHAVPVNRLWYGCQITGLDEVVGNVYDNPDLAEGGRKHDKGRT